jgi:hypothetical protein
MPFELFEHHPMLLCIILNLGDLRVMILEQTLLALVAEDMFLKQSIDPFNIVVKFEGILLVAFLVGQVPSIVLILYFFN